MQKKVKKIGNKREIKEQGKRQLIQETIYTDTEGVQWKIEKTLVQHRGEYIRGRGHYKRELQKKRKPACAIREKVSQDRERWREREIEKEGVRETEREGKGERGR
mmetsp:Transcript_25242/g.35188  ORF Transcript_25242/g.35188 Transcript_25242/m.35188 type:complete len:105 (-) Transcript_25242:90-404(-)